MAARYVVRCSGSSVGLDAAGSLLVWVPVIALFLVLSRYLISGLTLGAVKG